MAVVFLSFMLGDDRVIKEFGLGLGAAILIDTFIVRMTLGPAIMHILNERSWYIPSWLDRLLPGITIEPKESEVRVDPPGAPEPSPVEPSDA